MEKQNALELTADQDNAEEQLTIEVPVEIRAGLSATYNCCRRHAEPVIALTA